MFRSTLLCASSLAVLVAGCQRDLAPTAARTAAVQTVNTPVRVTMEELHRTGGVPPDWVFALPLGNIDAGRDAFVRYGCPSCHVVKDEAFARDPSPGNIGPDLTGMGSHHPEVYFVESILNPNAVIVDEPGYVGADGLSTMPAYPDLTAEELIHLVTYLKSLEDPDTDPHAHHHMGGAPFSGRVDLTQTDTPGEACAPAADAAEAPPAFAFFVQTYSLRPGQLAALERWFDSEGNATFRSFDGLLDIETHVDRTRGPESMVTVFSFGHMETLRDFLLERPIGEALDKFEEFAESIERVVYETRPVYRVRSLSMGGLRDDTK